MVKVSIQKSKITSLLHSLFKIQQDLDSLLMKEVGVGLSAYRILSTLDDRVASSQRKIAVELGQTEANVSRQVRHMAEANLVKIAPAKKDKRQRDITLTMKGQKKLALAERLLHKHEPSIIKSLKS